MTPVSVTEHSAHVQAFTWDINDSMFSDELSGEAGEILTATPRPVVRSTSDVSAVVTGMAPRMTGDGHRMTSDGHRRASIMSAQMPEERSSIRQSLMGGYSGSDTHLSYLRVTIQPVKTSVHRLELQMVFQLIDMNCLCNCTWQ